MIWFLQGPTIYLFNLIQSFTFDLSFLSYAVWMQICQILSFWPLMCLIIWVWNTFYEVFSTKYSVNFRKQYIKKKNQEGHYSKKKNLMRRQKSLFCKQLSRQVDLFLNQIPMTTVKEKEMKIVVYASLSRKYVFKLHKIALGVNPNGKGGQKIGLKLN